MPQRPPSRQSAPAEVIENLSLGYNGYTSPTLTKPQMWAQATNVFSGAFGYVQRCRFANVVTISPATSTAFTSLKYFALPGLAAYLLGDQNGKLFSFDSSACYAKTQRLNPYVDPSGLGSSLLNGPWSREALQNIAYEMNGQVKQSGRGANASTVEGFGLDAPDASPQVVISSGASQNITAITRSNGVVSATVSVALTVPGGNGLGMVNVTGVTDTSFNGTFILQTGSGTTSLTWNQLGQNVSSSSGAVNVNITKTVGRSYSWAWENANKPHVSAPSPSTQFIAYNAQNGQIELIEPGTVSTTSGNAVVTGSGTFFTSAWVGRSLWIASVGNLGRIISVASGTSLTLASNAGSTVSGQVFQVFDPQSTHARLYETGDGQAVYFRVQRNSFTPSGTTLATAGLLFFDNGNSEPPSFPYTTETSQLSNLPPPIGKFINEYQGRLCVFGVTGAEQSFFYSNQESTDIGMPQESFAPLNQVTLPIQNASLNGMIEFPGSAILWSDKQDMFRLTGLLSDNSVSTPAQQGAQIARLPYNLGCASPFAAEVTPLGGIWLTANAEIWLFTDRYAPRNIGRPVQDLLNSILPSMLPKARMKYYHTNLRNWLALSVAINSSTFNNAVLVLDLDLLASNGSPSYFVFDMATNHPAWWVFTPGPVASGIMSPRCDSLEVIYETNGVVRLLSGSVDLVQDIDFQQGFGTEIQIPNGTMTTHAWGNDSAPVLKHPTWIRFNTNRDPAVIADDGWSFLVHGIDDDFYTFESPLSLTLTPGVNDSSTLGGNPNLLSGLAFRHSPEMFRIGGVNFVAGRRMRFQVNFPSGTGTNYRFRAVQLGFGPSPPR